MTDKARSDGADLILSDHTSPLLKLIGVSLVSWEPGRAQFAVDLAPHHMNRDDHLHGGVIAAMLDAACGYAGLLVEGERSPRKSATAMLSISYLATAKQGRLVATGVATRSGRSLYFANGEIHAENGLLIATAQGTFKSFRRV